MAVRLKGQQVQMGTLGAGNHYAEIQVIDKVFDDAAARKMGIDQEGQVSPWRSRYSQEQSAVSVCNLAQYASIPVGSCSQVPRVGSWPTEN